MNYELTQTLIALAEACEGTLELHHSGIAYVRTNDELELSVELEDGRIVPPHQVAPRDLEEAIFDWRMRHPALFQRMLGAMM